MSRTDRSTFLGAPGLLFALVLLGPLPAARAGFAGFNNGVGWTANSFLSTNYPTFTTSTLTLTDGGSGEARSAFFNTAQPITNWFASFTYQATDFGGLGAADGVTFVLQTQSLSAVGLDGSFLGVSGINPSAEVEFNLFTGFGQPVGTAYETNGTTGQYMSTGAVNLASSDPILVSLSYNGSLLSESLTDLTTSATYSTSYATNLLSVLGSSTAYVGFTGGTGGGTSEQVISNFSFVTPEPSSVVIFVTGVLAVGLCRWRTRG